MLIFNSYFDITRGYILSPGHLRLQGYEAASEALWGGRTPGRARRFPSLRDLLAAREEESDEPLLDIQKCASCVVSIYPIGSMVLLYMVTFTINIPQMLACIPYMDPMGIVEHDHDYYNY